MTESMRLLNADKRNAKKVIRDVVSRHDPRYPLWVGKIDEASTPVQINRVIRSFWDSVLR